MVDIASPVWANPAGGWHSENIVPVYCTAEINPSLLNDFLLRADHRTYDGRRFSLCLVRSAEIHKYQPEGKAVCNFYKEQELFFVYQNDLARANKPPLKTAPPAPASLFRVSLELDEHTVFDKKTCLLRKNGRRNRRAYAEVRCDFSIALHAAISLRKRKVSIIQLQSEAALHGGAVPSKDRKATRSGCKRPYTPCRLTLPEPPTIWNHDSSPCPVFVIDNVPNHKVAAFLDSVNLPVDDADHAVRVIPVGIDVEPNAEPCFRSKPASSMQPRDFLGISMVTICSFVRQHLASGHLSSKHFIILDDLNVQRRRPKRNIPEHLSDLTCLIGDAFTRDNKGQPLLVRCSFDSCITILDDLVRGGHTASLRTYANDAAVNYCGCIEYPISRETGTNILAPLVSAPKVRSGKVDDSLTAQLDTTPGAESSDAPSGSPETANKNLTQMTMTQLFQMPGAKKVKREKKPERGRSISPDFCYEPLLPHSCAFGESQVLVYDESLSGLSEHDQELITMCGITSPKLEAMDASAPEAAKEDERQKSTDNRVDSFMRQDGPASEVDEDWYDIRLPDVTGLTQMI